MRKRWLGLTVACLVVFVAAPASAAVVAQDDFQRTVASGWGSAAVGGAWSPAGGAASSYSVASGRGTITHPSAGTNLAMYLNGVSTLNADARLFLAGDQPSGSNTFAYFEARKAGTSAYRFKVRFAADGRVFFRASRVVSNAETDLGAEVLAAGAAPSSGVRMRAQAEGTNPTTLRMKVWDAVAGTEPAAWQYTVTDSTGPQAAGSVGVRSYLSGSVTNAPRSTRVDELSVDDMATVPPGDPVIIGAGDIATGANADDSATAALVVANPGMPVFTLGDNVYQDGTAAEFAAYYEPTWGAFKSRTRWPVAGNHDYNTSGATGYYGYFGAAAHGPNGYWSDDTLSPYWHIIVLNSNCTIVSCAAGSAQLNWLHADLAANTKPCTVALWHHPRFSSGSNHGNDSSTAPFWNELHAASADLILNGHEHDYERFNRQTPNAVASTAGIQEFVVGTGGAEKTPVGTVRANSAYFNSSSAGVLKLTLHANSYDFAFIKADGTNNDAGTTSCHSAPVLATNFADRSDAVGDVANLDANATDADADALTYSATGLPAGATINASTGVISGTLTTAGVHAVTITVSDGTATDTDTFTWTVTATNTPPVVDSVSITPASPTTGQTVTANVTSHDAEGDTLTTSYQWTRNGTDIADATAGTLNLATAGNGDKGDAIRVRVTVADGQASSGPMTSSPATVVNSAPALSTNLADRTDAEGAAVNLDADATDADADEVTYSATGLPDGVSIDASTGAIGGTLTTAGVHGVTITASDGDLTDADTFTWTVTAPGANSPPVVDSVSITPGSPTTGETLTATLTSHDADGDSLTTSYQWTKNGTDLAGATSATLNLATAGNGDKGDLIRVRVSVSDGTASSGPTTSSAVTVANSGPLFSTNFADRSDAVGDAANLDADATDGDLDTLTYSATGLPAGVSINASSGVISGTLTAPAGVHSVTLTVSDGTATDTDTFTWTVTVNNTAPVVDSVTVTPAGPTTGQTLTANVTSHDADGDTLTTSYQWTKNGTDLTGATSATLNLATAGNGDKGDLIRVRVSVSDGTASSGPTTSSPVTVANSAPSATVSLAPASPTTNQTVTATATKADADAVDTVTLTYVWKVNGTTRRTFATTALTDTFDLSVAGNGDPGETVSVEVTPNDGTVNGTLATAQVTVAAVTQTVYANDPFTRTSVNTWGSAPTGGAYTLQSTVGDYDVTGAVGTILLSVAGNNRSAVLASVSALDTDLSFRVATDKAAVGGQQFVYGLARRVNATTEYRFKLRFAPNGAVFVQATQVVSNVETAIGTEVQVPGLTRSAGQFIWLRGQAEGASPTTLRMRAWADGSTEPSTWQYTATNAAAGLQAAGGVGVRAYLAAAATNAPVLVTIDDLRATSIG